METMMIKTLTLAAASLLMSLSLAHADSMTAKDDGMMKDGMKAEAGMMKDDMKAKGMEKADKMSDGMAGGHGKDMKKDAVKMDAMKKDGMK